ncbi:zf-HC2 domain-containing protein [Sinomonas halotolerans]|uniref:Zf-HC2 domain-containing protein n=1 Tax=Sinomonas halotolerans TaxID=1644133 RepID=A0ABU9X2L9_9MICC
MSLDHRDARMSLGAYLLGALGPEEARAVEAHVAVCAQCRAEVEELETLPALLDAVPAQRALALADAAPLPGEASAPPALLAKVRARRRALRARGTAALTGAAAASLVLGAALGASVLRAPTAQGPGTMTTASPAPSASPAARYSLATADGAQVEIGLVAKAWGTELSLECRGMPAGVFSVWVVADDGTQERAANWGSAGYAGRALLTGATSHHLASIREVQIRDESQRTLASVRRG